MVGQKKVGQKKAIVLATMALKAIDGGNHCRYCVWQRTADAVNLHLFGPRPVLFMLKEW